MFMQMKECKMPNNTGSVTVLGLESSCDETAAAIVRLHDNGQVEILSDCIFSQVEQHEPFGGVVPEIAARAHADIMDKLVLRALNKANLGLSDLDGVAATSGRRCISWNDDRKGTSNWRRHAVFGD